MEALQHLQARNNYHVIQTPWEWTVGVCDRAPAQCMYQHCPAITIASLFIGIIQLCLKSLWGSAKMSILGPGFEVLNSTRCIFSFQVLTETFKGHSQLISSQRLSL
jgi:hypothetical protein